MSRLARAPTLVCAAVAAIVAAPAQASPRSEAAGALRDAATLRRDLRYDAAAARLEAALPVLEGDARAEVLLSRAGVSDDPRRVRELLLEASRTALSAPLRQRADLELARLDLARGNYRSAQTRLNIYRNDPHAALLLGLAVIGLDHTAGLDSILAPARHDDTAQLLLGWGALQRREPRRALDILEPLAARRASDVQPTALLWKATAEAQLGDAAAAARTAAELRARFAAAPETDVAARAAQAPPTAPETATQPEHVTVQLAAFEDRTNAIRFRESIAAQLPDVRLEPAQSGGRTVYRVCLGEFDGREAAEAFAHAELDRRGLAWQIVQRGPGAR